MTSDFKEAGFETILPKIFDSRRSQLLLSSLAKVRSSRKCYVALRSCEIIRIGLAVLISVGCAGLHHGEKHMPSRQEPALRAGSVADASPNGAKRYSPPKDSRVLATAADRQGTIWILREDSGRSSALYTLLKQDRNSPPEMVAGPDSSFYFFLEEKIPDRAVALGLAKQELQRAIDESGRDVIQESLLQKGMLVRIQRDTYRAMGFQLPARYGILSSE